MHKAKTNSAWGSRFQESTDAFVAAFTASVGFDQRLAQEDIAGSRAHAAMLVKQGVLSEADGEAIARGLDAIADEIARGEFVWDTALEDVHMNIEKRLTDRIGDAGKRLHTGRSRGRDHHARLHPFASRATRHLRASPDGVVRDARTRRRTLP